MGYDLNRFAKDVDHEFLCGICQDVLENAIELLQCQHIYCNDCVKMWLKRNNKCPYDGITLKNKQMRPITRSFRNLLLKLEMKCDFVSFGCETVTTLGAIEHHVKHCLFNPEVIVKCDKGCGYEFKRKEYNTHNCVNKLSDVVCAQQKRISFLENLFRESQHKTGWHITYGLFYSKNDSIIKSHSFSAQFIQHENPINGCTYFVVNVIELGESKQDLRIGFFDGFFSVVNSKLTEENSVINYRSNGSVHIRQDNEMSANFVGHYWKHGDSIECGIKAQKPINPNDVVVYFKHNKKLITETLVKYSFERFYPTVYIWSNGAKVMPNLCSGISSLKLDKTDRIIYGNVGH